MNKNCEKSKNIEEILINTEYITLGQLLKFANVIGEGSFAKIYLQENDVMVNGEVDRRRGKKCRPGDIIETPDGVFKIGSR